MIIDDHCDDNYDDNYDKEEDDFILPWPAASAPPCPYKQHPPLRTDNTHPGHYLTSNPHSALHIWREKKMQCSFKEKECSCQCSVNFAQLVCCTKSGTVCRLHFIVKFQPTKPILVIIWHSVYCAATQCLELYMEWCAMHLIEDWQHPPISFSASTLGT